MKFPKDDSQTRWTSHVKSKMAHYGLSEQRIRRVIKNAVRREEGIAPHTVAVMQRNDTPKRKEEIWVMFQEAQKPAEGEARQGRQENKKAGKQESAKITGPVDLLQILQKPKMTIISAWRYPGVSNSGNAIPIPEDILAELAGVL